MRDADDTAVIEAGATAALVAVWWGALWLLNRGGEE